MSQLAASFRRQNQFLQSECETLAQAVDNLSQKLSEAYGMLKPHNPEYVARMTGSAPQRQGQGQDEVTAADDIYQPNTNDIDFQVDID